jgi:hypothetical protein
VSFEESCPLKRSIFLHVRTGRVGRRTVDVREHPGVMTSIAGSIEGSAAQTDVAVTFDRCGHVVGPFFHGTSRAFGIGDELAAGHPSNYHEGRIANHVYFTGLLEPAIWGAELATARSGGEGRPRVYVVEPTGPFEDDPNVTDKKFPGNVTRSYRTRHPMRIVDVVHGWTGHPPDTVRGMLEHIAQLREQGLDVIQD